MVDQLAVTQNCQAVGNRHNFIQSVRNENNGNSLLGYELHNVTKAFGLTFSQNSCRFVKDEQLDTRFVDLACYFHKLFIPNGKSGDFYILFDFFIHLYEM